MNLTAYSVGRATVRHICGMSVRHQIIHRHRLGRQGPYILACTHIGHLEPMILGAAMRRPVHWIARIEFFRFGIAAWYLRQCGAIPVNRTGRPVAMVREAIRQLKAGEIVGIFPEGGRTHGDGQAIRGAPIRGGACLLAMRSGLPIVPVVMAGTDGLCTVESWLPGNRTTVRTIVGQPIFPVTSDRSSRRAIRRAMTANLARQFVALHHELNGDITGGVS